MITKVTDPEGKNLTRAGKGRAKGSLNKNTRQLKDAILEAAGRVGRDGKGKDELVGYCEMLAADEPKAFASLLARVLPMQVTGADDGPLQVVVRRFSE